MRRWSSLLETELIDLARRQPESVCGFLPFYRAGKILAALPPTRGFHSWSSLILKFNLMPAALLAKATPTRMDTNTRVPARVGLASKSPRNRTWGRLSLGLDHAYQAAKK
jgi:hypothetical protein